MGSVTGDSVYEPDIPTCTLGIACWDWIAGTGYLSAPNRKTGSFIEELNKKHRAANKTGPFACLLSETEWEYAARAGTDTKYFFGDDENKLSENAQYGTNDQGNVKNKKPHQ